MSLIILRLGRRHNDSKSCMTVVLHLFRNFKIPQEFQLQIPCYIVIYETIESDAKTKFRMWGVPKEFQKTKANSLFKKAASSCP